MRILIISAEVWRHDTNGGNVLSNIFAGLDAEFAQIFCNPGIPSNDFCKKYYQITDTMIINNIFKGEQVGRLIKFQNYPNDFIEENLTERENKKIYNFFRKYNFQIFYIVKELLWKWSNWKNDSLKKFIEEFNPDIVFAPCYGSHSMLALDRYVSKLTKKPLISYISDDHYSLKHFRFSPLFWINRLILRENLKKTIAHYRLVYTMTDEQLDEYTKVMKCNMKILRKGTNISTIPLKYKITKPIKLIYAGSIYCGRWKTLIKIAKAIKVINKDEHKMVLHIYTGNELTDKQNKLLNDRDNSFVHELITQDELRLKYRESDLALHVESSDIKNRLVTRLSFSTKIVDCLSSGCAVLAISWKEHSGLKYLKKEDAAICIDDETKIYDNLRNIVNNPNIIKEYANKAYSTCKMNHNSNEIENMIKLDFENIIREDNLNENTTN